MKEQFCDYATSLRLKNLGFDEECIAGYQENGMERIELFFKSTRSKGVSTIAPTYGKYCHQNSHVIKAPLYQQVIDWLDSKGHFIEVQKSRTANKYYTSVYGQAYDTYKEALLAGINKCLTILEQQ